MSQKSTSPHKDVPPLDQEVQSEPPVSRDVKTDDHGAFRVHVQLLGQEWSRTP